MKAFFIGACFFLFSCSQYYVPSPGASHPACSNVATPEIELSPLLIINEQELKGDSTHF